MWKFSPEQCFTQMSGRRASFFWQRSEVGLTAIWSLSQNLINEKHITNGKSTENLLAICHSSNRAKDSSSINRGSKRLKNKSIWIKSLNSAFIHLQEQKLPLQCFAFQELEASTICSLTVSNLQYSSGLLLTITNFFSMKVFSSMKARTVLLEFSFILIVCVCESSVAQSCPTLCDPMDCKLPGSSVHRIFQERILAWIAISRYKGLSWPRDWTHVTCISCIGRRILYHWATWKAISLSHLESYIPVTCLQRAWQIIGPYLDVGWIDEWMHEGEKEIWGKIWLGT